MFNSIRKSHFIYTFISCHDGYCIANVHKNEILFFNKQLSLIIHTNRSDWRHFSFILIPLFSGMKDDNKLMQCTNDT